MKTVLLIDDDPDEVEFFQLAAGKLNLPFDLYYLPECNKELYESFPKPDFIFLDLNMPMHDGFSWLKGLREHLPEPVPVIMYSTSRSAERVEQAYKLGANLFISKPDSSHDLAQVLEWVFMLDWSSPEEVKHTCYAQGRFHITVS